MGRDGRLGPGQVKVPEKCNEIVAIDAIGCRRAIENGLHRVKAMGFRDDESRDRTRGEIRDPDLPDLQITVKEVRVSPDLKHAAAFATRSGRTDIAEKVRALQHAAPFLRRQLAHALWPRYAPEVSFQPGTSLDDAMHVSDVLHSPAVRRDLD